MIRINIRTYSTLVVSAFVMLLASCTKPSSVTNSNTTPVDPHNTTAGNASVLVNSDKTKLGPLFAAFRFTPQSFSVTPGIGQAVIGSGGTKLIFYDSSFVDPVTGFAINTGTIDVKLIEVYGAGAIIANRSTTTSAAGPVKCQGQIYITATQNGMPVVPRKYGVGFAYPDTVTDSMELYYGNTLNEDSVVMWGAPASGTGTSVTATIFDTTVVPTAVSGANIYVYKHHFLFDSVSNYFWVACQHLVTPPATLTNLDVIVPDPAFNSSNTEVYVVEPSLKIVTLLNVYDPIKHRFTCNYTIPTGTNVKVVLLSNVNGKYYYHEVPTTILNTNTVVTIYPNAQSVEYIKGRLSTL